MVLICFFSWGVLASALYKTQTTTTNDAKNNYKECQQQLGFGWSTQCQADIKTLKGKVKSKILPFCRSDTLFL
jgi:hypothetical protein